MDKTGNQNPTNSVILSTKNSDVEKAMELYQKSGREAFPWQEKMLRAILSKNDSELWTHTKCGYAVPRRNGKNEIVTIRELYGLYVGEQINHTAHLVNTSHAAFERLQKVLDDAGMEYKSIKAMGRERITMPESGGKIEFRTRTSTGGLGEGFDLLVIDEAQEYTEDQESALKYVVSSSKNPQTILCGTPPTPVSSGTVFVAFRKKVLAGGGDNDLWAEWSVEEEHDPHEKEYWYQTNPSLGYILTERIIQDEIGPNELDFNIQRLGYWVTYNQKSAITAKEWEALQVHSLPCLVGDLFVGVKYGRDNTNVAMSVAVKTLSGHIFVESIDCQSVRNGDYWILDFIKKAQPSVVVVDGASKQEILEAEMGRAGLGKPVKPTVKEIIIANSLWEQGIYSESICHMGQGSLTQVVTNCDKRPIGSSGGFGYKSQLDDMEIALMDSCILAHWACKETKPKATQKISY
ncbi:terminase large subunit [uncultured Levyella sp.]|uniref:terminase large subunit n=1 Tax=uncultured Levyella sp. TaxID=1715800 RepID=UPI002590FCB9|nr:terminase large subunit [uncultured Levyella sp.]